MMRVLAVCCLVLAACEGDPTTLTLEQLQDPDTCMDCHPKHYEEWSASMHAYASDDPVFLAMNKRGQRETNNALGTFCVSCHAPMAVATELTTGIDFDPATLPKSMKGVTCYFCHNVDKLVDDHNNGLQVALDTTMRGGVKNPTGNSAHGVKYDPMMDSDINDSAMCGSCHDVVTPKGVHLERTFAEWKTTFFADEDPRLHLTCGSCHMRSFDDVVADDPDANVPLRTGGRHRHTFAAIDQAMTPWPGMALNAEHLQQDLDAAVDLIGPKPLGGFAKGGICVPPDGTITVRLDTIGVGHAFPSGAAQDRRAWLEVIAYDASNQIVFQSGVVADGEDPPALRTANFAGFWDATWKDAAKTQEAHFFWDVEVVDSKLLLPPVTLDPNDPRFDHSATSTFNVGGAITNQIDRIEARMRIRPFAFAVLDELIASGDLDPSIRTKLPTLEMAGTRSTWTRATKDPVTACNLF
ncbi:MAG: hypothetical protein H0T79_00885 [Deltaproteobacteria bacterium]|nr:hypothetical protein [Deltaproteobacteria bacterium]